MKKESASEQTSASLPDDCQDYLGGNEPCALAPGNCKKCANPKQQPDTKIKTVSWEEYQSLYRDYYDMGLKVESLQKFKDYVHKRLDDAGVPVDPESPHKAAGCRIGGRLDLVLGQPDELSKAQERAQKLTEVVDHFLQWCELYDHTPAAYFHAKKVLKELQS